MGERFGPFSECAKQHVAVKPQKGELLSKNTYCVLPSMLQHTNSLCASPAAKALLHVQCFIPVVTCIVSTYANVCVTTLLLDLLSHLLPCLQLCRLTI